MQRVTSSMYLFGLWLIITVTLVLFSVLPLRADTLHLRMRVVLPGLNPSQAKPKESAQPIFTPAVADYVGWTPLVLPSGITTATVTSLAVHPQNALSLLLATQRGLYRSNDGGLSWARFEYFSDRVITEIVQGESNPQRIYLRAGQLFRTDDGGQHWRASTMPEGTCNIQVAPSNADRLYARRCGNLELPPVIHSDDGGNSWITPATPLTITFDLLAIAPNDPNLLVASNFNETWRSEDAGTHWQTVNIGKRFYGRPFFDRQTPPTLYLGHWSGLLRSSDSGLTWKDSDAARELLTAAPIANAAGFVLAGNQQEMWRFQMDENAWQSSAIAAPTGIETIWNSAMDGRALYAKTSQGYWRWDLQPTNRTAPVAMIFLPLVQNQGNTTAARHAGNLQLAAQCTTMCPSNSALVPMVTAPSGTDQRSTNATQLAIERVNLYRSFVGAVPLQGHDALNEAALNHTNYMVANYTNNDAMLYGAHGEVEGLPFFTGKWPKDRILATDYPWWGGAEVIHGQGDPILSIDGWMATIYHRFPILDPYHHYAGYGYHSDRPIEIDVLDFGAGPLPQGVWLPATPHVLAYPANGQTDVPTAWNGAEIPNPLPPGTMGPVGYPFTLQAIGGKLTVAHAALYKSDGTLVATHPNPDQCAAGRCLALIAVKPLLAGTTYVVQANGDVDGEPFDDEWRFTTGNAQIAVSVATTSVTEWTEPAIWAKADPVDRGIR